MGWVVARVAAALAVAIAAHVVLGAIGATPVGTIVSRLRPDERGFSLREVTEATFFFVLTVLVAPRGLAAWRSLVARLDPPTGAADDRAPITTGPAVALAVATTLALLSGVSGAFNYEDVGDLVVYWSRENWTALAAGALPTWDTNIGLGVPVTHTQTLGFHPLSVAFLVLPIQAALPLFVFTHVLIALMGTWWLCRALRVSRRASAIAVVTVALSEPTLEYAVANSWPTILVQWSMVPVLLLLTIRFLERRNFRAGVLAWAGLVIAAVFVMYGSHPGFSSGAFLAVGVFTLAHCALHRRWSDLALLSLAGVVALVIASDKLVALAGELARSPADLPRNTGKAYTYAIYEGIVWQLTFRPVVLPDLRSLVASFSSGGIPALATELARTYAARNADWQQWGPFFGPPLAFLAWQAAHRWRSWSPHVPALAATAVVCLFLLIPPPRLLGPLGTVVSGTSAFRDPLVYCGIALGSIALDRLWSGGAIGAALARRIVIAQLAVLILAAVPMFLFASQKQLYMAWTGRPVYPVEVFFVGRDLEDRLARTVPLGERVLTTSRIVGPAALLHAGHRVFDVQLKGVTLEELAPSDLKMYGGIPGDSRWTDNDAGLDVLGVRWLIGDGAPPPERASTAATFDAGAGRVWIAANADAWPLAVFASTDVVQARLPRRSSCPDDRFLCADFARALHFRLPGRIDVRDEHGDLILAFEPATSRRLALVSQIHRPGWTARSGSVSVPVQRALEELIAVEIPPGATEVRLSYAPFERVLARVIGVIVFAAVMLVSLLALIGIRPPWWRR